jgi:nitrite reductase (NADH) small subunit
MLAGNQVVCPLHAFRFDLATGDCDQPGACPIHVYPTEIRDNWVYLTLDTK